MITHAQFKELQVATLLVATAVQGLDTLTESLCDDLIGCEIYIEQGNIRFSLEELHSIQQRIGIELGIIPEGTGQ